MWLSAEVPLAALGVTLKAAGRLFSQRPPEKGILIDLDVNS